MATCTLCDLPTGSDPHTATDVGGEYCCRGCLTVARSLDDVDDVADLEARTPGSASAASLHGGPPHLP